jgi:hypothetical protein
VDDNRPPDSRGERRGEREQCGDPRTDARTASRATPHSGPHPDAPAGPTGPSALTGPATALRALGPSCGPVRLVAVDGHAGSGKSTFAGRMAEALGGAPVLHLDDLATHEQFFDWTERLVTQVLTPFAHGAGARYEPYDWTLRRFLAPRDLDPAPVVVVEGVGAGRRALRPYLARLLWMERAAPDAWERGRRRDGPALSAFWDDWTAAETRHFQRDPSRPFADALVREVQEGYMLRKGPAAAARPIGTITQSDQPHPPYRPVGNHSPGSPNCA